MIYLKEALPTFLVWVVVPSSLCSFILLWGAFALAQPPQSTPVRMTYECYRVGVFPPPIGTYSLQVDGEDVCTWTNPKSPEVCEVCTTGLGRHELYLTEGDRQSPPLLVDRLANFDSDGDLKVTFKDFSAFSFRYGECLAPNGKVVECAPE